MSEVGAKVDAFRSIADSAGKAAEAIRVRLLEVEKELDAAIRERDDAQAALARVLPRSCGAFAGPLTCARCTVSDQVLAEAERLDARRIDDLWRANEEQVRMGIVDRDRLRDLERAVLTLLYPTQEALRNPPGDHCKICKGACHACDR